MDIDDVPMCAHLGSEQNSDNVMLPRPFKFAEFFAGWGGLSTAMKFVSHRWINVSATLDGYRGAWNILDDEHFESSKKVCEEIDHGHMAPPFRTFTLARRPDEHGVAKALRSDERPEGWGDFEVVEANLVVARMVVLVLTLHNQGATFAIENPWLSYLWQLPILLKVFRLSNVELVLLHQCCYGAASLKPTGILTSAQWMKMVRSLCHEVRPHLHMSLVGKAWSYVDQDWVWRTSLAAEYPCGLCMAWASALRGWLFSTLGQKWLSARSMKLAGKWGNVLVRCSVEASSDEVVQADKSAQQLREEENAKAWGGLRNPRHAVARSPSLRDVGQRLRQVMLPLVAKANLLELENNLSSGVADSWVTKLRKALCTEFGAVAVAEGLQHDLWNKLLLAAKDPDATCLSQWIRDGFPLGILHTIENTGIFPATGTVSAAIEESRIHGLLTTDADGTATNYSSFQESVTEAQELMDQLVQDGRADKFETWQEVVETFGEQAKLTRLACLVKVKETGETKYRLVVDSRRSGINGLMDVRERVILPKISDVAQSIQHLARLNEGWSDMTLELVSVDFKDAFHMCPLKQDERQFVVAKDSYGWYHVSKVVQFGLSPGPLLWARLASAAMRLGQAIVKPWEAAVSTYVDDPLLTVFGESAQARTATVLLYVGLWLALGLRISWNKAVRGSMVQWIGFELELHGTQNCDLTVRLTDSKRKKLLDTLAEIGKHKGVFPLKLLQYAVGVLGWVSSVVPLARPWLAMLWAAITQHRAPSKDSTRVRKGLIFVKQVQHAVRWLTSLVMALDGQAPGLQVTFRSQPSLRYVLVQTDACPTGMGGFLALNGQIVAYWHDRLTDDDAKLFGAVIGDPSYQSEWELLAVWVSLELFSKFLHPNFAGCQMLLRTDNTSVIQAVKHCKTRSPIMSQ